MAKPDQEALAKAIKAVEEKYDADILSYIGFIMEPDDDRVLAACRKRRRKRKNVLLILSTPGGSADAAYRISRHLQRTYKCKSDKLEERGTFYLYVHDFCKSAGTLLALGATTLIMSQRAELGPIDVQLLNEEEVGERRSGLAPKQAMEMLATEAGTAFFRMFRLMRASGLHLPTKLAAESATKLAIGMIEPLYAQLDPIRMGEIERFVNIAQEYGERLCSTNVKKETISRLLNKYPSHEFVIDRDECREMFERVEIPSDDLEIVASAVTCFHPTPENTASFVQFLNAEIATATEKDHVETASPGGSAEQAASNTAPSGGKRSIAARGSRGTRPRKGANGGRHLDAAAS